MLFWEWIILVIAIVMCLCGVKLHDDNTPPVVYYWDIGPQKKSTPDKLKKQRIGKILIFTGLLIAVILLLQLYIPK